jgi:hypothetical protein
MPDRRAKPPADEGDDDQFAVRVRVTRDQADDLLRRGEFDFGDHPRIAENPDGTGDLDLFLSRPQIDGLRAEGFEIEVGQNQSATARERVAEIAEGDRFEGGKVPPTGLGRKIGGSGGPRRTEPNDRTGRPS